jgi:hypothetical protein
MGTLRSASDCSGMEVNGITLGEPTFNDDIDVREDALFAWDDSRLPNGVIENDGTIKLDEIEVV